MGDLEEAGAAVFGCLGAIVMMAVTWLLPLAIGIWILQAAGCV